MDSGLRFGTAAMANARFCLGLWLMVVVAASATQSNAQVVIADAVKLTHSDGPASGEVIADESEPAFSFSGTWYPGAVAGGYLDSFLFCTVSDSSKTAGYWAADVPTSGTYDVSTWYLAGTNRSTNTLYRILHAGGVSEVAVDQTTGGDWTSLGSHDFTDRAFVQISNRLAGTTPEDIIVDDELAGRERIHTLQHACGMVDEIAAGQRNQDDTHRFLESVLNIRG